MSDPVVINGKKYDLYPARKIGERDSGYGMQRIRQTLYQAADGQFFIYGEGGAMTCYRRRVGSRSSPTYIEGWQYELLSPAEARAWCERYGIEPDVIEDYFGDMLEEG